MTQVITKANKASERDREQQALADQFHVRSLILERAPQVAAQETTRPALVLDHEGLVNPKLHLERLHGGVVH